ncbi:MAG: hypothetical protein JW922_03760, partial [Paludibacteraceae bacterium]|nr:hypothetical protein [Paludibacteraceae bacterium]
MSKLNETGHAKNVANLEKLIIATTALGTAYNPAANNLKSTNLTALKKNCSDAFTALYNAESAYKKAVGSRDASFENLSKLVTRVFISLKVSGASAQDIEKAQTLVRLLHGRRAKAKKETEGTAISTEGQKETKTVSVSRMSYDSRIENLDRLIKLLTSITAYKPNEADLKLTALTAMVTNFISLNSAYKTAETNLFNARNKRNELLYDETNGLVNVANAAKQYVKSVFGTTSPECREISKLRFSKQRF